MPIDPDRAAAPSDPQLMLDTVQGMPVGVLWIDAQARVRQANGTAAGWLGIGADALQGASIFELVEDFGFEQWHALKNDPAARAGSMRLKLVLAGARRRRLGLRAVCVRGGDQELLALLLSPIDDRLEAESIQELQREVLEAVALGRPPRAVFDLLCRRVETIAAGAVCSVLLVEKNGTVTPMAGPSLPQAYVEALRGAPIGPNAGSCGTAAWRREPVEVTDIATDPLWADYAALLGLLGMSACWSTPVIAAGGEVVATFALYYRAIGPAPPFHRRVVDACVPLCRVALQHESNRAEIEQLAYFDQLTGLPNRRLFGDRARQALQSATRTRTGGAVLLLDVDRFKTTNDSLGHAAGDEVLRTIARRLQAGIGDDATVARLGGDEFAAILPRCGPMEAMHAAERLRAALAAPLPVAGAQIVVSNSIGISVFPQDGVDLDRLLKNAEMAMYEAKRAGRGASRFFTGVMNDAVALRMQMEGALRRAVAARSLELRYQPKIPHDGSRCARGEAVAGGNDPVLGAVPPERFIAVAEECGLIGAIDAWVLETACAQLAQWRRCGVPVPGVSVNVSPLRFHHDDVPGHVRGLLAQHGLAPGSLTLEITERAMPGDDERTRVDLRTLHEMGVRLSVDDFGAGCSSLGHLKRLPVSELKLDKSFVGDLERGDSDRALAAAVIGVGHALGLQVVAEGVETDGQRQLLRGAGCAIAQGFLFTRALPAAEIAEWLAGPGAAWNSQPGAPASPRAA
ncbi:MAG: EAL domain-containing protein [Burkholderiaceae bacterium]